MTASVVASHPCVFTKAARMLLLPERYNKNSIFFLKFVAGSELSTKFPDSDHRFRRCKKWKMGHYGMKATNIFIYVGLRVGLESLFE